MKLLLLAGMVYQAMGACKPWNTAGSAAESAGYTCTGACATAVVGGSGTGGATATAGTFGCAAGKGPGPAVATTCSTDNTKLTWAGCATTCAAQAGCKTGSSTANTCSTGTGVTDKLVCTEAKAAGFYLAGVTGTTTKVYTAAIATACKAATAPAATVSCTSTTGTGSTLANVGEKILSCAAGNKFTAEVIKRDEVACTTTAAKVTKRDAAAATCTACTNDANCKATKSSTTTCVTGGDKFQCTELAAVNTGYKLDSTTKAISKCAGFGWTATWDATTNCKAATCNVGYSMTSATVFVCSKINSCKAGAVPEGYAAAGLNAAKVAAVTGSACVSDNKSEVAAITGKEAAKATTVAGLGAVTCATGYTGTPKATCPVDGTDKAFKYEGCAKAPAAPAALAQTMIGFVLTIIAMYL